MRDIIEIANKVMATIETISKDIEKNGLPNHIERVINQIITGKPMYGDEK